MICNQCKIEKPENGKNKKCKDCYNSNQRITRTLNKNSVTIRYEKTKKGFLMRLYRNMQSRIEGVQKAKHHLYKGKVLIGREEFYDWSINNENFHKLFLEWELGGYNRKLTPSVDRVKSKIGYELSNMEWVTHSENSRRSSITKKENKNDKIQEITI